MKYAIPLLILTGVAVCFLCFRYGVTCTPGLANPIRSPEGTNPGEKEPAINSDSTRSGGERRTKFERRSKLTLLLQESKRDPDALLPLIEEFQSLGMLDDLEVVGAYQVSMSYFTPEQIGQLFELWPTGSSRSTLAASLKNYLVEEPFGTEVVEKIVNAVRDPKLAGELLEYYVKRSPKLSEPEALHEFVQRFPETSAQSIREGIDLRIRNADTKIRWALISGYLEAFQSDVEITNILAGNAVRALMQEDAAMAASWLLTQPAELVRGGDSAYVAALLADQNLEGATNYVTSLLQQGDTPRANRVVQHFAKMYAIQDPEASRAWVAALPTSVPTDGQSVDQ